MGMGFDIPQYHSRELPKRVTKKMIQNLREIKPITIRKQARIDFRGEELTYKQWKEAIKKSKTEDIEFSESPLLDSQLADQVLQNFTEELAAIGGKLGMWLHDWFQQIIAQYGKEAIAYALNQMPEYISDYLIRYKNDYQKALEAFEADILNFLPTMDQESASEFQSILDDEIPWDDI